MNNQNLKFYQKIKIGTYILLAKQRGLDKCKDIDIIYSYIKNAKVVADLGSGYGRAINAILKKDFKGKIFAVERVSQLQEYVKKRFKEKVNCIDQDIKKLNLPIKADAILWLGSGIIEFSRGEILQAFFKIKENLNKNGVLVIDISSEIPDIKKVAEKFNIKIQRNKYHYKVVSEWGEINNFLPTSVELKEIGKKFKFKKINRIDYTLDSGSNRSSYFFYK